ncbi:MAG: hypothetical protein ACK5AZ_26885 [Bryobacteraceae bacterium]
MTQIGSQFVPVQVFDPFNVTQVAPGQFRREVSPNAIIPASRLNFFMRNIVREFPLPNRTPDDPSNLNNYLNTMNRLFSRNSINARVDHRLSSHSLYGTFGSNIGTIDSPNGWGDGTRA